MNLTCAHGADALETWNLLHRGGPSLRDIDQRHGLLVAVGGAVLTSPDEINWTSVIVERTGDGVGGPYSVPVACREVKRIGDHFVVRGTCTVPDGTGQGAGEGVFASSDDGLNWDVTTAYYQGVYGGGWLRLIGGSELLLAVGGMARTMEDYGLVSATSDGMTWQRATLPDNCAPLHDACLQGPVKVAVGGDPLLSQYAPDWRAQILTSACGIQWTFAIRRTGLAFRRVTWGNGRYLAAGDGAAIGTSEDGAIWSFGALDIDKPWFSQPAALVFGNGQFLLLLEITDLDTDTTTQHLFRSADAVEWSEVALPSLDLWQDLAYGGGLFVAVGDRGALFTSNDGLEWTPRDSGVTDRLNAVRYINRRFLIVGDDGVVLSSAILPLKIRIARGGTGGPITLNWTGEGVLEEASVITGPWTPVDPQPNANLYSIPNTGSNKFYRLVEPVELPAVPSMVLIAAGTFSMGDVFSEGRPDEVPVHTVTVSAFYMDQTEVTKAFWDEVRGGSASGSDVTSKSARISGSLWIPG